MGRSAPALESHTMQIAPSTFASPLTIRAFSDVAAPAKPAVERPFTATTATVVDTADLTSAPIPANDDGDPQPDIAPPDTTPDVAPPTTETPSRAAGVLRKLAAGEFKGVADVRLRLNFADEIASAGAPLPAPSAASGKGKAHAKFLAAYQGSQPVPPTPPTPPTPADRIDAPVTDSVA
jgi:hypothetical protein